MPKNKINPNDEDDKDIAQPEKKRVKKKNVSFGENIIFKIPVEKKMPNNTTESVNSTESNQLSDQAQFELLIKTRNLDEALALVNKKSIDINRKNGKLNYTLLQQYVSLGNNRLDTIKLLIDHGANTKIKTDKGSTLLHRVSLSKKKCSQLINYLFIEKKLAFDVNSKKINGQTPLHHAAQSGNLEAAQFLIDNGANINAVDENGTNVLYYAVNHTKIEMVEFLLKNNVNTEKASSQGSIIHHRVFNNPLNDEESQIAKIINEKREKQLDSQLVETEPQEDSKVDVSESLNENRLSEIGSQKDDNKPLPLARSRISRTTSFYGETLEDFMNNNQQNKNVSQIQINQLPINHTLLKGGKSFSLNTENNSDKKFEIK